MSRKTIRASAITIVDAIAGLTVTDHTGRTGDSTQQPRAEVRWGEEEVADIEGIAFSGTQVYNADLLIDVTNRLTSGLQDFIDDTIASVKTGFRANVTLTNTVISARYIGATEPEISNEGDQPISSFTITVRIQYAE